MAATLGRMHSESGWSGLSGWDGLSFLAEPGEVADWRPVLLYGTAADMGLIDALPGRPDELAAKLGLDGHAVRVVLEALAVWRIVDSHDGERYVPGPDAPVAADDAVLRHHARSLRMWGNQIEDRLRGVPPRPDLRLQPLGPWMDALAVNARASAKATVQACLARLPSATTALDLGGGHGEYALELARRGLRVMMQDRPEVVELAQQRGRLEAAGVELFAGDFFQALPGGPFDLVLCAGVAYTFGSDANRRLWDRVKAIVAPAGALAVHTFLGGSHPLAAVFAVQMLMVGRGGDTHREEDYRTWLAAAGYGSVEVTHLARPPETVLFAFPQR